MSKTNYPFIVEFTGSPESGKTTCIKTILERFKERGIKTDYIQESAEIISSETNIPKTSFEATCVMRLLSVINIIKSKYEDYDLILVDRGLLDGIFFPLINEPEMYNQKASLTSFLESLRPFAAPDLLVVLKANPEASIKRKGHEGTIVNKDFVKDYNNLLTSFLESLSDPIFCLDTSNLTKIEVSDIIFNEIINRLEESRRT